VRRATRARAARAARVLALGLAAAGVAPGATEAGDEPLRLETLAGEPVALARSAGEALVVHFWATWCPDCIGELADLEAAAASCAGAARVVAVNAGESRARIARFVREHALGLPVLLDPGGRAFRSTGARGLPANLTWTRAGREVETGPRAPEVWRERLAALGCAPVAQTRSRAP
jgi:thiol-disulfide isomerase/thioredoxin